MMKKITIVTLVFLATTDPTSSTSLLSRQRRLRARQHLTTHRTSATALTATDPDPGMVMEATINKLKSTETLLRDTQTSMQSAVDKMVAKRSIGLDKHIAHTTEMVMKAFHKQEMTNLQRSTEARMNKWINTDNTTNDTIVPVNAGEVMSEIVEEDPIPDEINCNSKLFTSAIEKETDPEKLRALKVAKAEEDYTCLKQKFDNDKSQRDAARWKLAGDAQNINLQASYDEWKNRAEQDNKMLEAKEIERANAQMAEEASKSGQTGAAIEKMDQDANAAANMASDEASKVSEENNEMPSAAEMADQAAAAKREAEEASKKVSEMQTKMEEAQNEENIKKDKSDQAEKEAELNREKELRKAEEELSKKKDEENLKMEEKANADAKEEELKMKAAVDKAKEEQKKAYSEADVKASEKAKTLADEIEKAQGEEREKLEKQQKAEEEKKGSAEADIKLGAKKVEEAEKQQQQNEETSKKQMEEREKKSEVDKEEAQKKMEANMNAKFEEQSEKRKAEEEVKAEEGKKQAAKQMEILQKSMSEAEDNKRVQEENQKASEKANEEKSKAVQAKNDAERALADHMSNAEVERLKQKQKDMEEESLKTSERAKVAEQTAKDQSSKDQEERKKESERKEQVCSVWFLVYVFDIFYIFFRFTLRFSVLHINPFLSPSHVIPEIFSQRNRLPTRKRTKQLKSMKQP
jgi:hypothetical protein